MLVITPQIVEKQPIAKFTARFCFSVRGFVDFAAAAVLLMNERNFIDYKSWLIFAAVFIASLKKIDPILLIVIAGVIGYWVY